jgi:hypothetical protein
MNNKVARAIYLFIIQMRSIYPIWPMVADTDYSWVRPKELTGRPNASSVNHLILVTDLS